MVGSWHRLATLCMALPIAVWTLSDIGVADPDKRSARQSDPQRAHATPATSKASKHIPGLDDQAIRMVLAQQDLSKTLEILSEQTQLKITISKGLTGTVSRLNLDGTARAALDAICDQVGAIWWWNGNEIRLAARNDIATRTIKSYDLDHTINVAKRSGLPVDLIAISRSGNSNTVRISGPSGLLTEFEGVNDDVGGQNNVIHMTRFGKRRTVRLE
jgi:hypothetical protein